MADWFEHDWEWNILTLTSLPATKLEYDEACSLYEELEERLQDMERRAQQQDEEAEREYRETDSYLERFWRE